MGMCRTSNAIPTTMEENIRLLHQQPLAFSTAVMRRDRRDYITATSRLPFVTSDERAALLNVECFFFDDETTAHLPVLLYIHGVCSSAETKGINRLAREARSRKMRVAVLELEGHGLSSGPRGVCGDFSRLVSHVTDFVRHVLTHLPRRNREDGADDVVRYVLGGDSLGGTLAAYAAERLSRETDGESVPGRLVGAALVAPAVGVDPRAVPPAPVVAALRLLSRVAPAAASVPFTPVVEDPSSYSAPPHSTRNFSGRRWPLATSRMLLDLTARACARDLNEGRLSLDGVSSLVVFAGGRDEVVPRRAIVDFLAKVRTRSKELVVVPEGGHDVLQMPASATVILQHIFDWMSTLT